MRVAPDLDGKTFEADGTVEIVLDRPRTSIVLHGAHLTIDGAEVIQGDRRLRAQVTPDETTQTLRFDPGEELEAGRVALELSWHGLIHDDLRGLYPAGGLAVTQFEAADARRVFPCFDEPAFKAVWELTLEVPEQDAAISNGTVARETPGRAGRRLVRFTPTPPLSSYLIAFVIGGLESSATRSVRGVPVRTWALPDRTHLTGFAQDCATSVLPLLEDYFGRAYPFEKLDQLAIPDFEAGAMENVGCITFREVLLLMDQGQAPLYMQKRVAEVITHELAHQWFGNLVTMQWWDDLWLNEAFATWMAFRVVDQWRPHWRMWDDFADGKAVALFLDALESTHPIHVEVRNADEATENFDAVTYEKGAAILRMLEGFAGPETFRDGIRRYITAHEFDNATGDDLWNALAEASGQPMPEIAHAWIDKEGYPLIRLRRDGARVTVRQDRFRLDPERFREGDESQWLVPVVLSWADDRGVHEQRHLLDEREATIELEAQGEIRFVCGNRQGVGFYRVGYEPDELRALAAHRRDLAPVERVELLADAWALFRAEASELAPLLDLLDSFEGERDYTVLGEMKSLLSGMERTYVDEADRPRLQREVERLFRPAFEELGWEPAEGEDDPTRLCRAAAIEALALIARSEDVTAEARRRLGDDAAELEPNLLDAASIAAARTGGAEAFDGFVRQASEEPEPAARRRAIIALASVEEPELVERALGLLDSDVVPMQDTATFVRVILANRAAQDRAWEHLRSEWERLQPKWAAPMLGRRVVESLGALPHRRDEVEAFFESDATGLDAIPAAIRQTRERLRLDARVRERARRELSAWLDARAR